MYTTISVMGSNLGIVRLSGKHLVLGPRLSMLTALMLSLV